MGKLICTCGHSDWEINIAGNGFCNNCNRPMPKSSGLPILGHIFEGDEIIEEMMIIMKKKLMGRVNRHCRTMS